MDIQQQITSAAEALAVEAKKINDRIDEVEVFLRGQAIKVETWFNIFTTRTMGADQISSATHQLGFCRHGHGWALSLLPAVPAGITDESKRHLSDPLSKCSLPDRILAVQHLDAFLVVYYEALLAQQTRCIEILGEK